MTYNTEKKNFQIIDFDKIYIGQEFSLNHKITQKDVDTFAQLTGDYNPLHMDEDFAKKTDFQKPVVHGMLSASFISTMIGMLIPGPGALWSSQTLEFLKPAFIGDEIFIKATVTQKSEATRFIKLSIKVTNQHGTETIIGDSLVKVLKIAEEKKMTTTSEQKKTVLVTGGSKGIGAAIAKKLASDGFQVAVVYNQSKEAAEQVVKDIISKDGKAIAFRANVNNQEDVQLLTANVRKELGIITNLVHCASPTPIPQETMQVPWQTFEDHLNTQIKGAFLLTKELVPDMLTAEAGSIIFISSIFAEGNPPTQQAAYVTAKAGLSAFGRSLAVELGPKNIRVNTVSPGMTETDMIATLPEKTKMLTKMQTPLRRLAKADDIADTVAFLMAPGAKHITGENIRVCGGISMG